MARRWRDAVLNRVVGLRAHLHRDSKLEVEMKLVVDGEQVRLVMNMEQFERLVQEVHSTAMSIAPEDIETGMRASMWQGMWES